MDVSAQGGLPDEMAGALRIAGTLIDAGIPVFAAAPCPSGPFGGQAGYVCARPGHAGGGVEYDLPPQWQKTVPARVWLERWRPGWALGAVGGWAADFLDEDPRNGGEASVAEMKGAGQWPTVFGVQETPSGGYHSVISPLGERKVTGLLPGLDYQGGASDGQGRGFIWIAPTVKRSKDPADGGAVKIYRWLQEPDVAWLADFPNGDDSTEGVRTRIAAHRARRTERTGQERDRRGSAPREFTPAAMEHFLQFTAEPLRTAQIGEIEERANAYACALSHFVPGMLSAEAAYDRLLGILGETAYDPNHPASQWEAEKFVAVIGDIGGRAPADWHAVAQAPASVQEAVAAVDPAGDEVSALLAEMLPPDELAGRKPPRYMVKGVLTFDSTSWLIGGPGSKKSFTVLDMAAHVATGRAWQGFKVNKALVVYIAGEGAGSIGKRIQAWQKEYGAMPADAIRILPRPVQVRDAHAWAVLVQACARLRAAIDDDLGMFIIVDTQARSTVGLDENSAEEMGAYVDAVTALKSATRGCVLSVHHTTKAGSSTRGSGALDGAQDTRLMMESKPGELTGKLSIRKQKDLEEIDPIELTFSKVDVGLDEDGEAITSLVMLPPGTGQEWKAGLFDADSSARAEQEQEREINPFTLRAVPEEWTARRCKSTAINMRWALQALAEIGQSYGLTKAELRKVVAEKRGVVITESSWGDAFDQLVGERFADLVVKVHGAARWTIDPLVMAQEKGVTGE